MGDVIAQNSFFDVPVKVRIRRRGVGEADTGEAVRRNSRGAAVSNERGWIPCEEGVLCGHRAGLRKSGLRSGDLELGPRLVSGRSWARQSRYS